MAAGRHTLMKKRGWHVMKLAERAPVAAYSLTLPRPALIAERWLLPSRRRCFDP